MAFLIRLGLCVRHDGVDRGQSGETAEPGRAKDESTRRYLRRSLIFLATVTLVTAYFSETFFHPDEHASVLAFLGYKLGWTTVAELPWEFGAHIRSWMQPFLYYLIARPLTLAGMTDPFNVTLVLRLATGALSIASLAMFAVAVTRILPTLNERKGYAWSLLFYGFLPYLFVRTSSEALSGALFTAALALVLDGARRANARRLVLAGLLVGTAEAEARRRGLPRLHLGVRLALPGNRRLFARLGFTEIRLHTHQGHVGPTWTEAERWLTAPPTGTGTLPG